MYVCVSACVVYDSTDDRQEMTALLKYLFFSILQTSCSVKVLKVTARLSSAWMPVNQIENYILVRQTAQHNRGMWRQDKLSGCLKDIKHQPPACRYVGQPFGVNSSIHG